MKNKLLLFPLLLLPASPAIANPSHTFGLYYGAGETSTPIDYGLMQIGGTYRIKPSNSIFDLEYEAGYLWGGGWSFRLFGLGSNEESLNNIRNDSYTLAVYKEFQIWNGFYLFGKLGAGYTTISAIYDKDGSALDESSINAFATSGISYKWNSGFSLNAEYQYHFDLDKKTFLLGISQTF